MSTATLATGSSAAGAVSRTRPPARLPVRRWPAAGRESLVWVTIHPYQRKRRPGGGIIWAPPFRSVMTQSVSRSVGARVQAAGTLLVLVVALGLGALTDLGQAWLPQSSASLANSGASWAAVAFVLALVATGLGRAALWGLLGLAGLVGGYYLAAISRHVPESPAA